MRRRVLYTTALVIALLPALVLPAQKGHSPAAPAPVLKATVDKQKILIGQPIQLMLEATVAGNAPFIWPGLDSLPHFDFIEKGKVDSTIRAGERYYRQYMTVTSFDSGTRFIPRLLFLAANKKYFTDSVRIEVEYTKIDPSKDYHDIKEIIDVPNPYARWIGWIVAAVALISLALVVLLIRRKKIWKTRKDVLQAPRLSPYEEAMQQLTELERQHLPEQGSMKVYYSQLGDILRLFLLRRLSISSLAETSEELIGQLRRLHLPTEQFPPLAETLRMSDFVKFAKYQPEVADAEQHRRVIRNSIETMEGMAAEQELQRRMASAEKPAGQPTAAGKPGSNKNQIH